MPDDNSDTDQLPGPSNVRHLRWREKLLALNRIAKTFKPTETTALQLDTDIADFLGNPARRASTSNSVHGDNPSSVVANATSGLPENDVQKPSATNLLQIPRQIMGRRRREGGPPLQVRFTDAEPDIIGEGGDEAEIPAKDVTKSWLVQVKTSQSSVDLPVQPLAEVKALFGPNHSRRDGRDVEDPTSEGLMEMLPRPTSKGSFEQLMAPNSEKTVNPSRASWSSGTSIETHQRPPVPSKLDLRTHNRHQDNELWIHKVGSEVETSFPPTTDAPRNCPPSDTHIIPRRPSPLPQSYPPSEAATTYDRQPSALLSAIVTKSSPTSYIELISPYPNTPSSRESTESQTQEASSGLEKGNQSNNTVEGLDDFHSRVQHFRNVFRLAADASRHSPANFSEWLIVAKWWFLRGRSWIEEATHTIGQNLEALQSGNIPPLLKQAFVNLAKAWWIAIDVLPELKQSIESTGGRLAASETGPSRIERVSLLQEYHGLLAAMRALSISMGKNHVLPPYSSLLAQGVDTTVWIHYPDFAPNLVCLLSGVTSTNVLSHGQSKDETDLTILITDTTRYFSYGTMFIEIEIVSDGQLSANNRYLPCILSIIRKRTDYEVEIVLASQDDRIALHVQSDKQKGPTWNEVRWKVKSHSFLIHLATDVKIITHMGEHDFKNLWGIYDYASGLARRWEAQKNEVMVFDDISKLFQKFDSLQKGSEFPTIPLRQCRVRLFSRRTAPLDGAGLRTSYDGHRLAVMTPSITKTLSNINQVLGQNSPILFDYLRGEDGAPALLLSSSAKEGKKVRMVLTFDQVSARAKLHSLLDGSSLSSHEIMSRDILFQEFLTLDVLPTQPPNHDHSKFLEGIEWQHLRVIKAKTDHKNGKNFLSDRLRVYLQSNYGTVTDWINLGIAIFYLLQSDMRLIICLGPGELRINLSTKDLNMARFYRPAQNNLTISFAKNLLSPETIQTMSRLLNAATSAPTSRLYKFSSLPGM